MAIVWQMAGKFREGMLQQARDQFMRLKPEFDTAKGFRRAQILANENSRQIQFLTYWDNYDDSAAFFKARAGNVTEPITPYVEDMGTVVCSAVLFEYNLR